MALGLFVVGCGDGSPSSSTPDSGPPDGGDGDAFVDECPDDPEKTSPGACGCGEPDSDGDLDGFADCVDLCPEVADDQADADEDGIGDACDPCVDADDDGWGEGEECAGADCDDGDPEVWRTGSFYRDEDRDGGVVTDEEGDALLVEVCHGEVVSEPYVEPGGLAALDCDDTDADAWRLWSAHVDGDGDGHAESADTHEVCAGDSLPAGYVESGSALGVADCDDADASAWQPLTALTDGDGDGYAPSATTTEVCSGASLPTGYVESGSELGVADCDDADASAWRLGAFHVDGDGDGYVLGDGGGGAFEAQVCYGTAPSMEYVAITAGALVDCDDASGSVSELHPFYVDGDGDSFGAGDAVEVCHESPAAAPAGYATDATDCDDGDGTKWQLLSALTDADGDSYAPGATILEVCSGSTVPAGYVASGSELGVDDCDDGDETKWRLVSALVDGDGDGYAPSGTLTHVCSGSTVPSGFVASGSELGTSDCADDDATSWELLTALTDGDGDGYAASATTTQVCSGASLPDGYVTQGGALGTSDCDDADASAWRLEAFHVDGDGDGYVLGDGGGGALETQVCYGDAPSAEYVAITGGAAVDCDDASGSLNELHPFYVDGDGDSFGAGDAVEICHESPAAAPAGYATDATDCDDGDGTKWQLLSALTDADGDSYAPGATILEVCSGSTVPAGYVASGSELGVDDCDDGDETKWQLLSGMTDNDGDGWAESAAPYQVCSGASLPLGYVAPGSELGTSDCDDGDETKWQLLGVLTDADGDGWAADDTLMDVCSGASVPSGYVASGSELGVDDCDDTDPNASELQTYYPDADGDGYGLYTPTTELCSDPSGPAPDGYAAEPGDCDDADPAAWQREWVYEDRDGDGYPGSYTSLCYGATLPDGYGYDSTDCNDGTEFLWSSCETCEDPDGDFYGPSCDMGEDCAPGDPNHWSDCASCEDADGDGWWAGCDTLQRPCTNLVYCPELEDCDDANYEAHPWSPEIPLDGIDQDCDGEDLVPSDESGVFVSADYGSDSNPGTMAEPLQTLQAGADLAHAAGKVVFADVNTFEMKGARSYVSLYGGFDSTFQAYSAWGVTELGFWWPEFGEANTVAMRTGSTGAPPRILHGFRISNMGSISGQAAVWADGLDDGPPIVIADNEIVIGHRDEVDAVATGIWATDGYVDIVRNELSFAGSSPTDYQRAIFTSQSATHTAVRNNRIDMTGGLAGAIQYGLLLDMGFNEVVNNVIVGRASISVGVVMGNTIYSTADAMIAHNTLVGPGASLELWAGSATIANNILESPIGNLTTGIQYELLNNDIYGAPSCVVGDDTLGCLDVAGANACGWAGCIHASGNFSADPQLTADHHLEAGSVCIGAGIDSGLYYDGAAHRHDMDGDPRPSTSPDVGADQRN